MPAYMVPAGIEVVAGPLPRNANGKIDRKLLSTEWLARDDQFERQLEVIFRRPVSPCRLPVRNFDVRRVILALLDAVPVRTNSHLLG